MKKLFLLGILFIPCYGVGQHRSRSIEPKPLDTSVERKYDKFEDQTTVSAKPIALGDLTAFADYRYPGKAQTSKPRAIEIIFITKAGFWPVGSKPPLIFLADGKKIDFSDESRRPWYVHTANLDGRLVDTYSLAFLFPEFRPLVCVQSLEMKFGASEFIFTKAHIATLRALLLAGGETCD